MKLLKLLLVIILVMGTAVLWYQWSYPGKLQRLLYPLEYKESIAKAGYKYSIDPFMICAIIYVESKFNPFSESNAGALGLMQVMPATGKWIAEKQGREFSVDDLSNPDINIDMGVWYYNYLLAKYGDERLALAAYNSGDKNVDRWLKNRGQKTVDELILEIPYQETREFVQRIEKARKIYKDLYPSEFK